MSPQQPPPPSAGKASTESSTPQSPTPDATPDGGKGFSVSAPGITLPKGGGAIRGIGEKFAANPVTGTGAMTVPIATSPGRSGFGPELSISYDSGSGNGMFGFGWHFSLPSITRKTDQGLPKYQDGHDSDVFLLSGAEDLVPVLIQDAQGNWARETVPERRLDGRTYLVQRYRPRIEGLFARIERWTNRDDDTDVFWRSISKDNITSWYGKTSHSRITDPADPRRIFSWLICQSHDDKGNVMVYGYKPEDSQRLFEDINGDPLPRANERNRSDLSRSAQRYIQFIRYGNRAPFYPVLSADAPWPEPAAAHADDASDAWLFETVFDYGEHDDAAPTANGTDIWPARQDPFSSYRAGFEVRTYRLCRRVLMFHHFPNEAGVGRHCLVRSTDFTYSDQLDAADPRNPIYTFLRRVTQTGYRRTASGYDKRSLPPVEFDYSQPRVQETVEEADRESLQNLPVGLDGSRYRWTDLHGEGVPGIVTEQAGTWYYKRNLSPAPDSEPAGDKKLRARFAPLETVALKPHFSLADGAEFMDLAGDGQPDLVVMDGPVPGFYEHDGDEGWHNFQSFPSRLNRDLQDPNLKFIDLDGDGHADILITEQDAFVWHASLAEEGFGPAQRVSRTLDEEKGPRVLFADATQSIHLADLSGDGLTDIVRIRNGEVCYWPNLGYCRFGARVTMDRSPWFDHQEHFDHKRIRLADIDGSGTTDIIYLHADGVRLYFNQSGNSWSEPQILRVFPRVDDVATIMPLDLLGNGTTCLVWSSPLADDAQRPLRYVNLMGSDKPHLLIGTVNNLGAETRIHYAPSTRFYVQDKLAGRPWITRLPFPVHVVERIDTLDHISRNRFVTRYAYHHGYFDGEEREFRGFGMVEQWDTEMLSALDKGSPLQDAVNLDTASQVPPVLTRTWFHTGIYFDRDHISRQFAQEYYREPGVSDAAFQAQLLPDTHLPGGLTADEEREACRALKGMMLRQEVYALDGKGDDDTYPLGHPYTLVEQDFTLRRLQARGDNRHAVFFQHPREVISYHYERHPADPRVQHAMTLEVDTFGNTLKEISIGYGRRATVRVVDAQGQVQQIPNPGLAGLHPADQAKQTTTLITYTENRFTHATASTDTHRAPLPSEIRTYELTGFNPGQAAHRFAIQEWIDNDFALATSAASIAYEQPAGTATRQKRLIEHLRIHYRPDDLGQAQNDPLELLPLGEVGSLALAGESYQLAFTPGLLDQVFVRDGQRLLPTDPADVLVDGGYVDLDNDSHWWTPSGRSFFSLAPGDNPTAELARARQHFFLPRRYRDPFGQDTVVDFDPYDLLISETRDALDNRTSVDRNDYRVLQPSLVSDPNRNRTQVAFDILGLVSGTAVMGKPGENLGDSLEDFIIDPNQAQIDHLLAQPREASPGDLQHGPQRGRATPLVHQLLGKASSRVIYDPDRFNRSRQDFPGEPEKWQPPVAATIIRDVHVSDLAAGEQSPLQISFSYSDGFGREIQNKLQAEPGVAPQRSADGDILLDAQGQPQMTSQPVNPRWIGSGWTIFNNKGKPVRQYEPFFSDTHHFEFGLRVGISPVFFYDPIGRVITTLHPNHTYEKVVFDPWQETRYDVNDTCAPHNTETGDPRTDPDIRGYVAEYFRTQPGTWQTWHAQRIGGQLGQHEQNAAQRAAAHADTPTTSYVDTLGRPFLTLARNRVNCAGHDLDGTEENFATRIQLDIEGNEREVRDAVQQAGDPLGRIVMHYAYDMLGNRIHQLSMEAGGRWMLNDVAGKVIRTWDERGHRISITYDALRRPVGQYLLGSTTHADPRSVSPPNPAGLLVDRIDYGESLPNAAALNLRTRVYRHYDSAGVLINAGLDTHGNPIRAYDFKGNLLASTRRLVIDYKNIPDWSQSPPLGTETFTSSTLYDAVNRPTQTIAPHSNLDRAHYNIIQPVLNEAGLLERVDVWLERASKPDGLIDSGQEAPSPVGISNIDYDAKGQRLLIDYKNGTRTFYDYEPLTYRLRQLVTRRQAASFPDDDPTPAPTSWPGRHLQNLHYTYDPAGNITHIHDQAQQAIFFRNKRVEPSNDYVYDALYRLIQANGREHLGQIGGSPIPHSHSDADRTGLLQAGDGNAMGTYIERYVYDAVGNFLHMQHRGSDPAHPGWTRHYVYEESSLIETGQGGGLLKTSNRLSHTSLGNGHAAEHYRHDIHGNMTRMPHLGGSHPNENMRWDYRDQLYQVDPGSGTAFYVYDAAGQRVRKVWEKAPGLVEERFYLGGFEIFRRHNGAIGNDSITLERETLHVMDDQQRIALVDIRSLDVTGNDPIPKQIIRCQLGNHLGSSHLELDEQAKIISYEEYSPYGSSTYQAVRTQTETANRYRYTGKERDEESGLYYYGARYYSAWLGIWTSCDPKGLIDSLSLYIYTKSNPIKSIDPDGKQTTKPPSLRLPNTAAEGRSFIQDVRTRIAASPNSPVAFQDRGVSVVVMRLPEPYVVQRGAGQTFTDAAVATNTTASETVINTNLYEYSGFGGRMGAGAAAGSGPTNPANWPAQGQVIRGGTVVGGRSSPSTYHFAWTRNRPEQVAIEQQEQRWASGEAGPPAPPDPSDAWQFGQGDPPSSADVAFGGGIPVIINGLPFGTENRYASGAPSGLPTTGDPGESNRRFLTQRSNLGFTSLEGGGATMGKVIMGIERESNLLIIMVQEHGASGMRLSQIRDSLTSMGVDDALAWDGSDSATLVRDSTVTIQPGNLKNNTIPFGAGFRL